MKTPLPLLRVTALLVCLGAALVAWPAGAVTPLFRVKALLDRAQVLVSGGSAEGLEAGDVLFIHDNQRNVGRLTVSRVTETEAYAMITHEAHPGAIEVGHYVEFEPIREKVTDQGAMPLKPGAPLSSPVREAETLVMGARYSPSKLQEVDERVRALKREINLGGEDARLYVELGEAYLLKNELDTAINWLKQGVQLEQNGDYVPRGLYRIAQAYALSGRNDRAVRYLNYVTANYPASPYNKTLNQTAREAREMFEDYSLEQSLVEPETRLERSGPRPFSTSGMRTFETPAMAGAATAQPALESGATTTETAPAESTPAATEPAPVETSPTETAMTPPPAATPPPPAAPKPAPGGDFLTLLDYAHSPGPVGVGGLHASPVGVARPGGAIKLGIGTDSAEDNGLKGEDDVQFGAVSVAVGENVEVGFYRGQVDRQIKGTGVSFNTDTDITTYGLKYMGGANPDKRVRYGLAVTHTQADGKGNVNIAGLTGSVLVTGDETDFYAFGRWAQDRSMIHGGFIWRDGDGVGDDNNLGFFASYASLFGQNALGFVEFVTNDEDDDVNVGLRYRMGKTLTLQAVAQDVLDEGAQYSLSVDYKFGGEGALRKLAEAEGLSGL